MNQETDIICVGQAVVDCITRGLEGGQIRPGSGKAESITLGIGGDAVNEAVALRRLGFSTAVLAGIGDDPAGKLLLQMLRDEEVETGLISVLPAPFATPVANIFVSEDGSRSSVSSGAARLEGYVPSQELFSGAKIVTLASLFRAPLDDPDSVLQLVIAASMAGAKIFADTKLPTFRETSLDEISGILSFVDCIFPNEKEAAYYTGETEHEAMADAFLARGVSRVVIKLGADGCLIAHRGGQQLIPACPQTQCIDTTGAGDNFAAGFLSALLDGLSFADCARYANACAAVSVESVGAATGVRDAEQVQSRFRAAYAAG